MTNKTMTMEKKNGMSKSEKETLELVLQAYMQEQADNTQAIQDMVTAVNGLTDRIADVSNLVKESSQVRLDTAPLKVALQKGILDLKVALARRPQPIVRKFQVLLFPEQDARLFYKIVFGRWLIWLSVMLLLNNVYKWGVHYTDVQNQIRQAQVKNNQIRKAWDQLYNSSGREVKRKMNKIYEDVNTSI